MVAPRSLYEPVICWCSSFKWTGAPARWLSDGEAADFEEHYLDCQACINRVEEAERLERGLRSVAEQEVEKAVGLDPRDGEPS